jgi:hypothetical protein
MVTFSTFANTPEKGAYCCVRMATVVTRRRHIVTYAHYLVEIMTDGWTRSILELHILYRKSHILPWNLTTTRKISTGHPQINDSFLDQLGQFFAGVHKFSKNQDATYKF